MPVVMTEPDLLELHVTGGLAGFPPVERYALVEVSPTSPLFRLCSLDEPGLDFLGRPAGGVLPRLRARRSTTPAPRGSA